MCRRSDIASTALSLVPCDRATHLGVVIHLLQSILLFLAMLSVGRTATVPALSRGMFAAVRIDDSQDVLRFAVKHRECSREQALAGGDDAFKVCRDGSPVTWFEAAVLLHSSDARGAAFRSLLTESIASAPFHALFWETPPFGPASFRTRAFEFVLINAPALASARPDPRPFSAPLARARAAGTAAATFTNLGGDAILVAPVQRADGSSGECAHLASFLRTASDTDVAALWRSVGVAVAARAEQDGATWVSTSGLGVSWLHVRLDSRPKYYQHRPYRDEVLEGMEAVNQ
jgi:hypothetical protein